MNKYDLNHVTTAHARMSAAEWGRAYDLAWRTYYSFEHVETVLRRAAATRMSVGNTLLLICWFKGCIEIEGMHPLEGGYFRIRDRRARRPGLPIEPAWRFYPRYLWEAASKQVRWVALYLRLRLIYRRIKQDPHRRRYTDLALTPVADDETETHALFASAGAHAYVEQERRLERLRQGEAV